MLGALGTLIRGAASSGVVKGAIGSAAGGVLLKAAGDRVQRRGDRRNAIQLAKQVQNGRYSEAIVAGSRRYVVWRNGEPIAAFPHLEGNLSSYPELQDYDQSLTQEPPPSSA